MILSDSEIFNAIDNGELGIEPFSEEQVQPASVDVTLGDTFSIIADTATGIIIPSEQVVYNKYKTERFVLLPNQFVLATTREYIRLPNNMTAFVEGRSSWGRLGLFVQNAGWVDSGFEGEITLELFNANRRAIELKTGMRIGQLVFAKMEQEAINPYRGKYQGQKSATGSLIHYDFNDQ